MQMQIKWENKAKYSTVCRISWNCTHFYAYSYIFNQQISALTSGLDVGNKTRWLVLVLAIVTSGDTM